MNYIEHILKQSEVKEIISEHEQANLNYFKNTFSTNLIYSLVEENLRSLISDGDLEKTYLNIKMFSKEFTLNYLNKTPHTLLENMK